MAGPQGHGSLACQAYRVCRLTSRSRRHRSRRFAPQPARPRQRGGGWHPRLARRAALDNHADQADIGRQSLRLSALRGLSAAPLAVTMLQFNPSRTKVVFFDLEYYVPVADRRRKTQSGMLFSPVVEGHKILGGHFQTYFPMTDTFGKVTTVWEWKSGTEREVLRSILRFFEGASNRQGACSSDASLMLCGIGISHSDVPTLLSKMTTHKIAKPTRIYDVMCGSRQIDLSVATYCQFSSKQRYFSYPKSKAHLYQKYLGKPPPESGKLVWDMYDSKKYAEIEARCADEVSDIAQIYKAMFDLKRRTENDLSRLKRLVKEKNAPVPSESDG